VAGATEIGVELNKKFKAFPLLISTEGVSELTCITSTSDAWRIGGAATLTNIEEALGNEFPSLAKMLRVFAARQIRNRATLGGNLATASPIGDAAPLLQALDARVRIASAEGERTLPLDRFFTAYRRTALEAGELLVSVIVPKPLPPIVRFYKVAKRQSDDISTVAACFSIGADGEVRIAYGGVAPTPVRVPKAEEALAGGWTEATVARARDILAATLRPIGDHRGSAAYRLAIAQSLLEKFRWQMRQEAAA
jgi:xanthine dehydrogenase iron-sulfur cluster and FAD-binding subunit A